MDNEKIRRRHKWLQLDDIPDGYLDGYSCERCGCKRYFKYVGDYKKAIYFVEEKEMDLAPECLMVEEKQEKTEMKDKKQIRAMLAAWDNRTEEFPELEIRRVASRISYESLGIYKIERKDGPSLAIITDISIPADMFEKEFLSRERIQLEIENVPANFGNDWLAYKRRRGVDGGGNLVYHIVSAFTLSNAFQPA